MSNTATTQPAMRPAAAEWRPSDLRAVVCDETLAACRSRFGDKLRAIVLTGSVARDEATLSRSGDACIVQGDAEFLLVFDDVALPARSDVSEVANAISRGMARRNVAVKIDLSAVHPVFFRRLPPHIFSDELRECGKVIHGDAGVLRLIPPFRADRLDKEDAWRLLCNRLIELLEFDVEPERDTQRSPSERQYRLLKLYLDMGTSLLVFAGAYAPTYRGRKDALVQLAARASAANAYPFPLPRFAEIVSECTEEKLGLGQRPQLALNRNDAIERARLLWRWELSKLTGAQQAPGADLDLIKQWMRRQPLRKRLRGWLYVARACGWHRSFRQWPRWVRLSMKGSPRYWIYYVAAELLFSEPEDLNLSLLRSLLPALPQESRTSSGMDARKLASAVVWNYRAFVVGTRA